MVEIIPKTPQKPPLFIKILFALSIGVFIFSVGGFVVLFFLESRTQNKVQEIKIFLQTKKTQEEVQLEQDVRVIQTRLKDFATLLGLKKDMLPVFSFLETVVHPQVTFLSMNIDTNRYTLVLQGTAESFFALDEQFVVFQAREEPDSISLTDLQVRQQGGVNFQMEIQFPANFFQQL